MASNSYRLALITFAAVSTVFAAASDLFVCSVGYSTVVRYDGATGAYVSTFCSGNGLNYPLGLAWGPDNNFYVCSGLTDQLMRFDGTTGTFINVFTQFESGFFPSGVVLGPDDNFYVTSRNLNKIENVNGTTGADMGTFSTGTQPTNPYDPKYGPDGNLYVVGSFDNNILRYNATTGAFMNVFTSGATMTDPRGMYFGPDGNLYVSSLNDAKVFRFNGTSGVFMNVFCDDTHINRPRGVIFGPDANLYLAVSTTGEVLRFNGQSGAFMDSFASANLQLPSYIAFGPVYTVRPTSFSLARGIQLSGGLPELLYSDDTRLVLRPGVVLSSSEAPIQLVVEGTSPAPSPTKLKFRIEAQANQVNLSQKISLFDFTLGTYVDADTRPVTLTDSKVEVTVTSNAAHYVEMGTNRVRARANYKAAGPILSYPWQIRVDQTVWTIGP